MDERIEDLTERARADDPAAYQGDWAVDGEGFADREPEVLVSRSLRVSVTTYEQVRSIAAARGMSPSALMREWIEDGVAAAPGQPADPVSLVDRLQRDVASLAHALRRVAHA